MSASLSADSAPADPDDELLVAYLDGELKRSERGELENRLLSEAPLRGRLTELQSSWDMLDILSVDGASVSLVETTLELAIADVSSGGSGRSGTSGGSPSRKNTKSEWRTRKFTYLLVLCVMAGVAAWLLAAYQSRQTYRNQLRDLAIAQDLDAYNYGGDLELMRVLAADPDWTQMIATAAELTPESTLAQSQKQPLSKFRLDQRTTAIEQMTVDQRELLGSRWDAFSRLSIEDKETIRQRAAEVTTQPDQESLLATMQSYATWRSKLPGGLVDQIEGDDTDARRQAIQDAIEESKSSMVKISGSQLDDETVEVIYFALQEFAKKRISKDQRRYKPPGGFRGPLENPKTREWFAIQQLFGYTYRRQPTSRGHTANDQGNSRRDLSLTSNELATIESLLPLQSQETLDILTGGDRILAAMTLQVWAEEVIRRKRMPLRNDESLLDLYHELSDKEREKIDLMPPEKMIQLLWNSRRIAQ